MSSKIAAQGRADIIDICTSFCILNNRKFAEHAFYCLEYCRESVTNRFVNSYQEYLETGSKLENQKNTNGVDKDTTCDSV